MSLVISDDLVKASGFSENELLLEIVLRLFQQDKISLEKASELLGLHRIQFQKLIAEREICVHYDIEDFQEDLKILDAIEEV
jgi:predicted HTH domain antitoxin